MSRRLLISIILIILAAAGLAALYAWLDSKSTLPSFTDKEMANKHFEMAVESGQTNLPMQSVLAPLDLSQSVRLAIGGLGLADNNQNQQLGDLVTAELSSSSGFNLVERQSLDAILKELNLSLHGFVRAKDAVRAGKLLKADWFLLGTVAEINGTNAIIARVVDARTGILRDAGVFPCDKSPVKLAADLAFFMRQSRQNAASAKIRVYLAIGAFEDLSANNLQADFPTQIRGYLMAAYQGGKVTLLEREYVDTLLQEVRLDLAGLTEDDTTNPPSPMQSAFWLVSGQYQSYETTNLRVELNLNVQRMFGKTRHVTLRDLPGEPLDSQIKSYIDETLSHDSGNPFLSRVSEVRAQMTAGRDFCRSFLSGGILGLIYVFNNGDLDSQSAARQKRNVEEAMRAFQTVLLLESTNREAKMYLAACLRDPTVYRLDDARNYYREIIEEPVQDEWSEAAQKALLQTFDRGWWGGPTPEEEARWFESAYGKTTNLIAGDFYRKQAEIAEEDVTIKRGDSPEAGALAEKKLFTAIQQYRNEIADNNVGDFFSIKECAETLHSDPGTIAQKLAELLPKMENAAPEMRPYLLSLVLRFQVDTNAPVVAEFERTLNACIENPNQVFHVKQFWNLVNWSVYDWCVEKTNYALGVKLMEGERRAAAGGHADFNDQDKIKLAYSYLGVEKWDKALAIFEAFSNQPVQVGSKGLWGDWNTIVLPGKQADYCRQKLGLLVTHNPMEFSMGKPLLRMCTPSTFIADDNGLWIGISGQLLHLDFDLKTNLVVNLPIDSFVPITTLCLNASNIWIGTDGAGLLEFDKATHTVRPWTENDGLMMNSITSLQLADDTLWIGYGTSSQGGLGKLDIAAHQFISYTPSLTKDPESLRHTTGNVVIESTDQPTRRQVIAVAGKIGGDAWFATEMHPLRHYQAASNTWDGIKQIRWVTCLLADDEELFAGQRWNELSQDKTGPLGIRVLNIKSGQWRSLKGAEGIPPGEVTTLCRDSSNLWVGGMGYIADVDPTNDKMLHFAYIQAKAVDRIQTGGGYVWAQFDWHLYRVPLSSLQ